MRRPPLVLLYHGFGDVSRELDVGNLIVRPDTFRAQIAAVRDRGYRFETVSQVAARVREGAGLDGICAITFDDGLARDEGDLPAMLAEINEPVSIFICPGLLGAPHRTLGPAAGIRLTTAGDLAELARLPHVEIGSHTSRHVDLSHATAEEAYRELATSKAALEELIGFPVTTFAYPWCVYSAACPPALERAGYLGAVTCGTFGGWVPYEIPRISVGERDGRLLFMLKANGVYMPIRRSWVGRTAQRSARLFSGSTLVT